MKDTKKTKSQLIDELVQMRQRIAQLEASEAERKRVGEVLQESENRYKAMFDNRLQMVYINDGKGLFLDANDYALERLGYTRDEIRKVSFQDVVHPDDLPAVLQVFSEIFTKGFMECPVEIRLVTKSGEIIWVDTFGIPLERDVDHYIALGIAYDITERKRVEEALRESEERYRLLAENVTDVIWAVDANLRLTYVSPSVTLLRGYSVEEAMAQRFEEWLTPASLEVVAKILTEGAAGHNQGGEPLRPPTMELELTCKDGSTVWTELRIADMLNQDGQVVGTLGISRDITERRRVEEALRESEERLRALIQNAPDAIYTNDLRGNFIGGNRKAEEMMGYSRQELTGSNFFEKGILPQEYVPKAIEALEKNRRGEPTGPDEFELVRKDGSRVVVEISTFPVNRGGEVEVMGIARDITERKRAEMELKVRDSAIASSINAIAMADLEGKLIYVNPSFLELWGYDNDKEVLGRPAIEFWEMGEQAAVVVQALFEKGGWRGELTAQRKNGSVFDVELSSSMVTDEYDKPFRLMASFIDITERKKAEETIKHLAYHDTLTGLPNRPLFNEILTLELARAQRNQQQVAVMLLDLDEFKHVNDTLGHPVGDQLLKAVADRMRRSVRKADTIARMGGDEFTLILPDLSQAEDAARIAQKLMAAFTRPFVFRVNKLHITSSIGIAIYPHDGEDSETLMKNADIAMYRAKEQGRNNYQYYTPAMNGRVLVDS